jgi:hypothetical protein
MAPRGPSRWDTAQSRGVELLRGQGLVIVRACLIGDGQVNGPGRCGAATALGDHVGIPAHDQSGPPCLPAHHLPLLRLPIDWLRPVCWHPISAGVCSATSPRSPTPAAGVADGIHWSACSASRSARCWPARGRWPPSPSGPATRPGRSWPRSGCAATRGPAPGSHPARRLCAGCWPASTPIALDRAIGAWLAAQQPPPSPSPPAPCPPRRAVAVDGKTLRGSGHHGHRQVHLLAVMDHTSSGVLGQAGVDGKTN